MGNKAKNFLAILCLIFAVSACNDEKPDDTEQSKPTATTDKRCQKDAEKDSEKNEEDEVDCVVDNKNPDTPDKSDDSELKGQDLWDKYAPKACYKSLSSSGTVRGNGINAKFSVVSTNDSNKISMSGTSVGCTFSSTQVSFKDKPGFYWSDGSCGSVQDSMPPSGHENLCYAQAKVSNVKLTKLNGKDVLYAEYSRMNGTTKVWYNLKPFYPVQEVTGGRGEQPATMIHTNVKINEPIDDKVFAQPKK